MLEAIRPRTRFDMLKADDEKARIRRNQSGQYRMSSGPLSRLRMKMLLYLTPSRRRYTVAEELKQGVTSRVISYREVT